MSHQPRIAFESATYHITSRGNNRQTLFHDPQDFVAFLLMFSSIIHEFDWSCFSFCLMTNHYHTIIQTPLPNLPKGIHKLHCRYSHYYRGRYPFTGKLFEGRYDSSLICDDSYLLEAIRYDLLNPVRANLVKDPALWPWSSYNETAGLTEPSNLVSNEWVRSLFGDKGTHARFFMKFIHLGLS